MRATSWTRGLLVLGLGGAADCRVCGGTAVEPRSASGNPTDRNSALEPNKKDNPSRSSDQDYAGARGRAGGGAEDSNRGVGSRRRHSNA